MMKQLEARIFTSVLGHLGDFLVIESETVAAVRLKTVNFDVIYLDVCVHVCVHVCVYADMHAHTHTLIISEQFDGFREDNVCELFFY